MSEAGQGVALSERKGDWFFVCVFAFFAWSSIFSDAFAGLGLIGDQGFWPRANAWYASMGDPYLVLPLLFAVRIWRPEPFGRVA